MTFKDTLSNGFQSLITKAGKPIRIRYFTELIGSVWDDEVTLAQSGTGLWTSGIVMPINAKEGSSEALLVSQGKLINHDQKLFISGGISLTGSELEVKIGLGSPITDEYSLIPEGIIAVEAENQKIYNKVFIRRLTIGSIYGE